MHHKLLNLKENEETVIIITFMILEIELEFFEKNIFQLGTWRIATLSLVLLLLYSAFLVQIGVGIKEKIQKRPMALNVTNMKILYHQHSTWSFAYLFKEINRLPITCNTTFTLCDLSVTAHGFCHFKILVFLPFTNPYTSKLIL